MSLQLSISARSAIALKSYRHRTTVKMAPEIGQLAPGKLIIVATKFLSVELAAEADTCEILAGRIVTVKTSRFGLSPKIISVHVREYGVS